MSRPISSCSRAACLPGTAQGPRQAPFLRGPGLVLPRTAAPRPRGRQAVAPLAFKGGSKAKSRPQSPEVGRLAQEQWKVDKMTDMVHLYFDQLLSKGRADLVPQLLDTNVQHKDMVRDEARQGHEAIAAYLRDLHAAYPKFWSRAAQVGVADERTVFCSFEGQATERSPMFAGVDRFVFSDDVSKIVEIEIYRSNWHGTSVGQEAGQRKGAKVCT